MKQATGQSNDNGIDDYKIPKSKKKSTPVETTQEQTQPQEEQNPTNSTIATRAQERVREVIIREDRRNYRKHSEQNLKLIGRSLDNYGAGRSIVADNSGAVIGGNGTLREANKRGIKQRIIHTNGDELVVVVRDDIAPDDPRRQELAVMDNSTTDSSEFDFDLLQADFSIPELENFGVIVPDIDLGDDEEFNEGETDPDAVPETPEEPKSKRGCVYQLGKHRLMCGDSTSADDVAKLMNGEKADMVFTDPPYNVAYNGRSGNFDVIKNDDLNENDFADFISKITEIIKFTGAPIYYIWCNWKFYGILQEKLEYKSCIVWAKNVFGLGNGYRHQHEFCLFNGKIDEDITSESDLWEVAKDANYLHPTQKPVALCDRALKNHKKVVNVLDFFGGSGSTLIACEQRGRICRTMELDEKYVDVIRKRYAEFAHGEGCDWEKLTPEVQ